MDTYAFKYSTFRYNVTYIKQTLIPISVKIVEAGARGYSRLTVNLQLGGPTS